MKSKRQEKILELIHDHSVQTQEQLLAELNDAGFRTTQATISRDIKQLRIIKELGPDGVYRYSTTPKPVEHTFSAKLNLIFRQCITSVDYAQKLTEIIRHNEIQSVTVVRMEVPCCGGLEQAVKRALQQSGKWIPWQVVTLSTDGRIIDE